MVLLGQQLRRSRADRRGDDGRALRDELSRRIIEPLGLADTDLPAPFPTPAGLARGYLPADNPLLPDPGPDPVDVTDIEPFGWGGSGMVSTARDLARFLQALLGGELLPQAMMAEMLSTVTVASDWEESDGYGLGIEDVTSIGDAASPCGAAWGHFGFSTGYTTIPLASRAATAGWSSCSTPIPCPRRCGALQAA
jgi:Beta-lactamase class C and other penicillin binding proteins